MLLRKCKTVGTDQLDVCISAVRPVASINAAGVPAGMLHKKRWNHCLAWLQEPTHCRSALAKTEWRQPELFGDGNHRRISPSHVARMS